MLLLALDTCTERLIVGVRDTETPGSDRWINLDSQGNHARDLLLAVESLLEGQRPGFVGVALGPGSFTGVRIGLATAKGLAEGWQVPLAGLDNLAAMARTWDRLRPGSPEAVLPVIDARKKKFYGALYSRGKVLVEPADLGAEEWMETALRAADKGVLSGFQGSLLARSLVNGLPAGWSVLDLQDWTPELLDQLDRQRTQGTPLGPHAGPRYLRLSEAEESLRSRTT